MASADKTNKKATKPVKNGKNANSDTLKIALVGNPNSGKTTLFNALTGSNQYVGNWPGVTVEKKEGKYKQDKSVVITDLPGIYSLSPYSPEEVVARSYLTDNKPAAILNIVDATNLERNLFLTTQLVELGIPVVLALNMMDAVKKSGDIINTQKLAKSLGCKVVEISALKGEGIDAAAAAVIEAARGGNPPLPLSFSSAVESALAAVGGFVPTNISVGQKRWFAVKLLERDTIITEKLGITDEQKKQIEQYITTCETEMDDDSESIVTSERYDFITDVARGSITIKNKGKLTISDKIDRVVTNRWAALPIFVAVMFLVYFVSVTTVGALVTDWTNDGLFGDGFHLFGIKSVWVDGIPVLLTKGLEAINCAEWLQSLLVDGIIGGVGAVLGFVPQLLILFVFLALLEGCGYLARVAFIMDRIFRRFGLSGKSFIPILIGTGCGVPGLMASRTIENEKDRKMTLITTTFIPCSAKLPIIALIAGALFGGAWWVAPTAYFIGIAAIICSGIILKKTKPFKGEVSPFIMELPAYRRPTVTFVLRSTWERGWSFIKKAGTIILLSTIFIWFTSSFGVADGKFGMVDMDESILAKIGGVVAWIFKPLGFGDWQATVAAVTGLIAKENVVGTFGILYGFAEVAEDGMEIWGMLAASFSGLAAFSFLVFNLLCAPCFAAMGAIKREMNSTRWFLFAIFYQCILAYLVSLSIYQLGMLFSAGAFGFGTVVAFVFVIAFAFMLFTPVSKVEFLTGKVATFAKKLIAKLPKKKAKED